MPARLAASLMAALLFSIPAPTGASSTPPNPPPFDHVGGGNVTPPGNSGHIPATALPEALTGSYRNPNMDDQLPLYVDFRLKDWSFARPGAPLPPGADPRDALGEPYSPRPGVVIYRDGWGVPRIFGRTDADAQFGAGYAVGEDRLFQADVLRRVARGEMAEFVGGQAWYDYDRAWRRQFYTDDELLRMFRRFYKPAERELLYAYVDGLNRYIEEALRDPRKLPAEYVALGQVPRPWEVTDSLALFVLQARDSVEGFGGELFNAELLQDLRARLGPERAAEVFGDVRFYRDPGAYTTAPASERVFPYPGGGFEGLDAPGSVLPDADDAGAEQIQEQDAAVRDALRSVGLGRSQASNAIAVTDDVAADRRPILLGGPQLTHYVPSIFYELEVHSPSLHARGVGFAGTMGIVLIGKTPTHAWSITYGYTDQVDTFLVPLDPNREDHYLRHGKSRPMETYTTTVRCKADHAGLLTSPAASDLCDGLPVDETTLEVRRIPQYGPVIGEVSVDGRPHAVVRVRAHWMREVQNGRPFLTFNRATTIDRFRAAQRDFNISLNVNYVDDRGNAGFWHVAAPPVRAEGTDIRLPTLGDGRFDWRGFVPLSDVPHAINPAQGFTANWNNQPGAGWHNGDNNYWADYQRVDMLARRMEHLAADGSVTPAEVWNVNREAAFEDRRFVDFGPLLGAAFEGQPPADATAAEALEIVLGWNGQRTSNLDGGTYRYDSPAVGIFDRFMIRLQRDVMADELGTFYDAIGPDFAPAFYQLKPAVLLRILQGESAALPARHDWLDGVSAAEAIRSAFREAVAALAAERGGDPSTWRTNAVMQPYSAMGLGRAAPHPFMNRGTYNELAVVDVR